MSKSESNFELLDMLSEEEIITVCKNTDLTLFLTPIKDKRYTKYAKTLGRLDKKSVLVQSLLPGIAFKLYKKGEESFKAAIATQLDIYRDNFSEELLKRIEPPICVDDIRAFGIREMAELYFKISDNSSVDISVDLFFVLLKLQDIVIEDGIRQEIEIEIRNIGQVRKLETKYKEELEEALKEQKERLSIGFEQQKCDLKKQIEEKNALYKEILEKLSIAEEKIQKYDDITQAEKKKCEEEWFAEYEKQLEARKAADDIQWKKVSAEIEAKHQELTFRLEKEAEKKSVELEEEYRQKLKKYEEMLSSELSELREQVNDLNEKKNVLNTQIDALEHKKVELDSYIQKLVAIEEEYFESFEQRVIERKIDSIILKKLGCDGQNNNTSVLGSMPNERDLAPVIIPPRTFSENSSYGEPIGSIEDFFEDYKTNVSLDFNNETEVAGIVLASILNKLAIVSVDSVCNNLSEALAALLDLSSPLIVSIDSEKDNLKTITDVINNSESQVVCIKGLLDNYNENLLARICDICVTKYLFFSISDLESLKMMSKAIMNYAVVIDAEKELRFPKEDDILIGNCDLKSYAPSINVKKSQRIYKKIFSRLVTNEYIKKSVAIEYSNMLQMYLEITDGKVLGKIIQKSIIYACNLCYEDDNLSDVLNKSEITIPIK